MVLAAALTVPGLPAYGQDAWYAYVPCWFTLPMQSVLNTRLPLASGERPQKCTLLPILFYLGGSRFRTSLLTLIVRLTAPLPDRLEQTCRLLRAQFPLCCRWLAGR